MLELHGCCAPGVEHGERRVRAEDRVSAGPVHEVLQPALRVQRAGQASAALSMGESVRSGPIVLLIEGPSVSGEGTKDITVGPLATRASLRAVAARHEDVVGLVEC